MDPRALGGLQAFFLHLLTPRDGLARRLHLTHGAGEIEATGLGHDFYLGWWAACSLPPGADGSLSHSQGLACGVAKSSQVRLIWNYPASLLEGCMI